MATAFASAGHWPEQKEPTGNRLAPLRDDLKLISAPANDDGSPAWMLHDPVRHQFYRLGRQEFEILKRWQYSDIQRIVSSVNKETTLSIAEDHVQRILTFLRAKQLLNLPSKNFTNRISSRKKGIMALLLGFLYQRIPVIQPDTFLESTLPFARFWFLKGFWLFIGTVGILGAYLTIQQWEVFIQTFLYFYSFEGMVYFAAAITLIKAGHELAHAYTAKRYGLHVPVIGVAFIIFWPLLFTDTTDAWKLKKKGDRVRIGIAGVAFEIAVAIFATLLWHLVPEGPVKSVLFLLATSTWIVTLTINLNPFMRFDGYYILSDFLDIPNLQPRSFVLGRWFIRRLILGVKQPCPEENLSAKNKTIMVLYAFSTWVYRCVLYTGIALIIYHLFFKLAGLVFFTVEIGVLIVAPVMKELKAWTGMRTQLKFNVHLIFSIAAFAGIMFFLLYPWNTSVKMPALLKAKNFSKIYASESARIKEVRIQHGQKVKKGDTLFVLASPDIAFQKKRAKLRVDQLQAQMKIINFTEDQADQIHVMEQQLVEAMTKLSGAIQKENQLEIVSPISGRIADIGDALITGRWVNETDQLALIVATDDMILEGYVHEQDRGRIQASMPGIFYPADTEEKKLDVFINSISPSHTSTLEELYLASQYGGDLPARKGRNGTMDLQESYYKVIMQPSEKSFKDMRIQRGTVKIKGTPVSYFSQLWKNIQALLIRESGF